MNKILVITGSARPNSVNQIIVDEAVRLINARHDARATVADLAMLKLPYFNSPTLPSDKNHVISDDNVKTWSSLVSESDAVLFVAPEYNHSLSGIQKNAIDWLYSEWQDKPTGFVGYGAYAGKNSYDSFLVVSHVVKMRLVQTMAGVKLGEVVGYDGAILDQSKLKSIINVTIEELIDSISQTTESI